MPNSSFKVITGAGDWGSPLSDEPAFETLDEAVAAAREYLTRQRKVGDSGVPLRVVVEETKPDGSVAQHRID
jgi:hypothetical protein